MVRKAHCDAWNRSQNADVSMIQQLESDRIQLKQLLINEQVFVSRLRELQLSREQLQREMSENILLKDKWASLLSKQVEHDKSVVQQIPIDEEASKEDVEALIQMQKDDIKKLKEQLELRDRMVESVCDSGCMGLLSYEGIVKATKEEQAGMRLMTNLQANKLDRFRMSKIRQYQTDVRNKHDRDKRNCSVISQNSSVSTGASSGLTPGLFKIINPLVKDTNRNSTKSLNRLSHRKLLNAGARIVIGPTKSYVNTNKLPFMAVNDLKEPKQKYENRRASKFLLEKSRPIYENSFLYH